MQNFPYFPNQFAYQPNFAYFPQNHSLLHPEFPPFNPEYIESINRQPYSLERNIPHPIQKYPSSEKIKQATQAVLSFCTEIAGLDPLKDANVITNYSTRKNRSFSKFSYVDNSININSRNRYPSVSYSSSYKNQAERKREKQIQLGVISVITLIIGSFILGSTKAERDNLDNQMAEFHTVRSSWASVQYMSNAPIQNMNRIITATQLILDRRLKNNTEKIALIIAGLVAAGLVLAGAIAASEALVIAGGFVGLGVGVAAMYKLGYHCFSNAEKRDIETIQREIRAIHIIESKKMGGNEPSYFDS